MGEGKSVREVIIEAITKKRLLRLWYNGGTRIVEPHAIGCGTKQHDLVRVYQTEGHSEHGQHSGWKLMIASGWKAVSKLELLPEKFNQPRDGYKRGDKAMLSIYAQL